MTTPSAPEIAAHYAAALDGEALLALIDHHFPDGVTPNELAPVDQLHLGGRSATRRLLGESRLRAGMTVLDLGCGLGGTSRTIADTFGCSVIGLDLTPEFIALGEAFNRRLRRPLPVRLITGDACRLPFADHRIDAAVSQHCLMNLPDLPAALTELRRVVRPGGSLFLHELVAGNDRPLHFPLPWASAASQSHLRRESSLQEALESAGFSIRNWQDISDEALSWRSRHGRQEARGETGPLHAGLVYGPRFRTLASNLQRCLAEGSVRVIQAALE